MAQYQWLTFTTINTKISEHERAENESRVRAHVARVGHARRKIRVANVHRDNHIEESDKRVKYKLQSLEFRSSETPSPRVIVDNARKEPFQVWSIDLLDNEHELLDTYINVFQLQFYGKRPSLTAFSWFRDVVFPQAIQNPVVFRCGVLGIAAHLKAHFRRDFETIAQDVQSLELLRKHFEGQPNDHSDDAIIMCVFRSLFDDFQGHIEASWIHLYNALRLIRLRGGPAGLKANPVVALIVNCYDYRTRGYAEGTMLAHMVYTDNSLSSTNIIIDDSEEVAVVCEELVQFLHNAEHLSSTQRSTFSPRRHSIFKPGSVFHDVFTSPLTNTGAFPNLQLHTTFGMSILLHLNAALWDFRKSPELSELFLNDILTRIVQKQLDIYRSMAGIAQFLMYPSPYRIFHNTQYDRLWKVGRLLKISKRLNAKSWHRLWHMLLSYLMLEAPNVSIADWENDLRCEITDAVSTRFVMSILEEATP